jgi:predicted Ser/Thr protein kinase
MADEEEAPVDVASSTRRQAMESTLRPSGAGGGGVDEDDGEGLARGAVVGRYVVLSRIGKGGMGVVYAAYDPELDRKVALKLLLAHRGHGAEGKVRLVREAQAMARLAHPSVVTVYDVGALGEQIWLAMEFIRGQTLTLWHKQRPRRWQEVVELFVQAGEGLQAAHAAGLIHRDFKPDNVMIDDDGRVRVMDFGLARVERSAGASAISGIKKLKAALTTDGAVVGTPQYMAAEQWEGGATDARSDQFSFCVALWETLYGRPPFAADTVDALVAAVLAGQIQAPARREVPGWLQRALVRGLAVDPQERWPSMGALLAALRTGQTRRRQGRWLAAVVAAALAVVGVVVGLRIERAQRQAHAEVQAQVRGARAHASALVGHVLAARLGLLVDYDPLVLELRALTGAEAGLRRAAEVAGGPRQAEILAGVGERDEAAARATILIEGFKTRLAVVRNSSQVFPLLAAELTAAAPEQGEQLLAVLREMLRYNNTAHEGLAAEIRGALAAIAEGPAAPAVSERIELLRRHAEIILEHRPELDRIVQELLALQGDRRYEALAELIAANDEATRGVDDAARWGGGAAGLLGIAVVVWLVVRKRRAQGAG